MRAGFRATGAGEPDRIIVTILRKSLLALIIVVTGLAFAVADLAPVAAEMVVAQRAERQPGLFERLFGPRRAPPPIQFRQPTIFKKKKPKPVKRTVEPAAPVIEVEAKDPNARKILVIGDFVGSGIAWGLDQSLAKETRLAVVDRTNASSGLVRPDHYDWNKELLGILNEEKPDIVVVALGSNDRQQMRMDSRRLQVRTPPWEQAYIARVDGLVDTLEVYGRPFFWVSAPPVRNTGVSTDMAWLNMLYKPPVLGARGYFVDVWNGFTNANGQYVASGPDIDGQVRALRSSDGIGFTRAGRQKLAYYVEREIRRQTGVGAGTVDLLASTSQTSQIEIGPDGKKRLVGPIISLSDPLPGASDVLAGAPLALIYDPVSGTTRFAGPEPVLTAAVTALPLAPEFLAPTAPPEESALFKLVVKGEPLPGAPGRVDDFAWPPGQRATQTYFDPDAVNTPDEVGARAPSDDQLQAAEAARAILTPTSKN